MRSTTIRRLVGASLIGLAAFVTGLPAHAAEPIRIGAILSVTGPAAFLGSPELKTLELYLARINEHGGVLGRRLELIHYDTGTSAAKANAFAKRLIESDKVDLIIGPSTTGATMGVVPLVEAAGIPLISLAGAVVIIEPVKKWVFKTPHTDRMAAEKVFEDMKQRGLTKIALLSETSGFGQSGRKQALAVAPEYGIDIIADETYGAKDTDMTAQLTNIRNTPGVEALFVFGFGQAPAIVTKNYGQLGMEMPHYESHGVASERYIELAGDAAEGVRLPAAAVVVAEKLPAEDPQRDVVVAYKQAYEERYHEPISTFGGHAYDGLMIAVDAIRRAGSTDKEKVRAAIESTHGFMGTGGLVNMSPTDHLGLDLSAFRMLEIRDGDWVIVD